MCDLAKYSLQVGLALGRHAVYVAFLPTPALALFHFRSSAAPPGCRQAQAGLALPLTESA